MAKKLIINCSTCDVRNALEENYSQYEQININCAMMMINTDSKSLINKLPLTLNCSNVLELEKDIEVRTINGKCEVNSGDIVPESKYYMMVNGSLTIGPNTQKELSQCVGIIVNGLLTCPESIYKTLNGLTVNGTIACYPDNAIILKRNAVIDKMFILRAKNSLYWSERRIIFLDSELDTDALKSKGAKFSTKEVIVSESKIESLIDLIDEKTEIITVPNGTSVIIDDITLDDSLLHKYGNKFYVIGDVTVPKNANSLKQISYLNVRGDIKTPIEHKEKLLEVLTEISGNIKIAKPKNAEIADKPFVKVTKWMLEHQPLGIDVSDCAIVKISDDIPKELILQRLHIEDCGIVKCSEELEDAVNMICTDVGHIGGENINNIFNDIINGMKGVSDTKVINASHYIM